MVTMTLSLYGECDYDPDQPVMEATNDESCELQETVTS